MDLIECQTTIYGSPGLFYGTAVYGGCYNKALAGYNTKRTQPLAPGLTIIFRAPDGSVRAHLSSWSGLNPILACRFEVSEKGPASASIELLGFPPLTDPIVTEHGSWFEIYIWGSLRPTWTGTVVKNPGEESTEKTVKLEGHGFIAFADDLIASGIYVEPDPFGVVYFEDTSIRDIAHDFSYSLGQSTFLTHNPDKIVSDQQSDVVLGDMYYVRTKFDEVFDELARFAGGWVWGVDTDREVFFKPRDRTVSAERTLIVGRDFEEWKPREDSSEIANFLHVRHGNTNVDQTNQAAFGTNYLSGAVQDAASQNTYGLREDTVSVPAAYNELDAYRYGFARLEELKSPKIRAQAPKLTYKGRDFEPGATYRIISGDSVTDHICKRARYDVKPSGRTEVTLYLGEEEDNLALWGYDLDRKRALEDAERRTAQFTSIQARPPS